MKKHLYIALLCLTSIAFSQDKEAALKNTIDVELKFGKYTDCFRPGSICTFDSKQNKNEANATATYNKDNTITLVIDRAKITKEDEVKIVGQQLTKTSKVNTLTFVMEDDFVLEQEIKSSLKTAQQSTKIAKGSYPIQITKETFTITVKLE